MLLRYCSYARLWQLVAVSGHCETEASSFLRRKTTARPSLRHVPQTALFEIEFETLFQTLAVRRSIKFQAALFLNISSNILTYCRQSLVSTFLIFSSRLSARFIVSSYFLYNLSHGLHKKIMFVLSLLLLSFAVPFSFALFYCNQHFIAAVLLKRPTCCLFFCSYVNLTKYQTCLKVIINFYFSIEVAAWNVTLRSSGMQFDLTLLIIFYAPLF